jgi:spore germination cell wall hydrolase CwlJ-like protein
MLQGRAVSACLGIAIACAASLYPAVVGRQDVGVLAGASSLLSWRTVLLAEGAEPGSSTLDGDGFGGLASMRPPPMARLGQGFILALSPLHGPEPQPSPPMRRDPFTDRTARSDKLPVNRGELTASMRAGMVTPAALHGMAARPAVTPSGMLLASTTPQGAEQPVAVASMPVLEPLPVIEEKATFRLASLPADSGQTEGVTSAARTSGRMGETSTRLSHLLLLPESDLRAAQKCLAEAVYFEARGEPERGQYAVAQVVMNRTRSGFYPNKVCKVVYQNKHMFNACQFSFACDRYPDKVYSRSAWDRAMRIAKDVTENGAWLPEVGGATHYHADYIRAWWAPKMIRLAKLGRHIFFRPRWLPDLGREPAVSRAVPHPGATPAEDS